MAAPLEARGSRPQAPACSSVTWRWRSQGPCSEQLGVHGRERAGTDGVGQSRAGTSRPPHARPRWGQVGRGRDLCQPGQAACARAQAGPEVGRPRCPSRTSPGHMSSWAHLEPQWGRSPSPRGGGQVLWNDQCPPFVPQGSKVTVAACVQQGPLCLSPSSRTCVLGE